MATATQSNTRKPNTGDNKLPTSLSLAVSLNGADIGGITLLQNDYLSDAGNVTYVASVKKGWKLPGDPTEALEALGFAVNGIDAVRHDSGVHLSAPKVSKRTGRVIAGSGGNPTVGFSVVIPVTDADGESRNYMAQVYATFLQKEQSYNLTARAFPQGAGRAAGPQVKGEVTGLIIDLA